MAFMLTGSGAAQGEPAALLAQKATYTRYFTKFVSWPAPAPQPLQLCVTGVDAALLHQFQALTPQSAGSQRLVIAGLNPHETDPAALASCHVLYVGRDLPDYWQTLLAAPRRGLLVIVDDEATLATGAIRFVKRGARLLFAIDQQHARGAELAISAKLIALGVRP